MSLWRCYCTPLVCIASGVGSRCLTYAELMAGDASENARDLARVVRTC